MASRNQDSLEPLIFRVSKPNMLNSYDCTPRAGQEYINQQTEYIVNLFFCKYYVVFGIIAFKNNVNNAVIKVHIYCIQKNKKDPRQLQGETCGRGTSYCYNTTELVLMSIFNYAVYR